MEANRMMKKLLITGASGFLGWNMCTLAKSEWNIFGTVFSHPVKCEGVHMIRIDLRDYRKLKKTFDEIGPDAVVHAAAAASPDYCQTSKSDSYKINVDAAVNIAGLCADRKIPLAFTSTDLVFDGRRGMYKENDPVNPVNVYGEQKVTAEQKVLDICQDAAVCRMPLILGMPSPAYKSSLQPMITAMREGRELTLFTDEFRSPVSAETAGRGLLLSLEKVRGIIHLGGRERVSRYDLGVLLADILHCGNSNIRACKQKDITFAAPRAADVSLDSSKAFALGYDPLPLREELEKVMKLINL
jgi:dTDP-4-dehydrorhamnose reductase